MVDGRLIRSPRRTPRRGAEKRAYPQGQWSDERTSTIAGCRKYDVCGLRGGSGDFPTPSPPAEKTTRAWEIGHWRYQSKSVLTVEGQHALGKARRASMQRRFQPTSLRRR